MNEREQAEKLHKEHPAWGYRKLAEASGCGRTAAMAVKNGSLAPVVNAPGARRGIAVKDFLQSIDYVDQIRKGIVKHLRTAFVREDDFRALLGMRPDRFRRAVDRPEFDANKKKKDGYTYWSTAENVKMANSKEEQSL